MPQNAADLEQILIGMTTPDNNIIRECSDILKAYLKKSACVEPMFEQIAQSQQVQARQMAAVLLRTKIAQHWLRLPDDTQARLRELMLARLVQEQSRPVRIAVAATISAVAKVAVPKEKWPGLLDYLFQMSQSEALELREVAMLLFRALAENIGAHLKLHMVTLLGIFSRGLVDPSEVIRLNSLQAIGTMTEFAENDEHVGHFRALIPPMVDIVKHCIATGDEQSTVTAFQVFDYLAESPVPVITHHIPLLVDLMLSTALNRQLSLNIREQASLFVSACIEGKPGKFVKSGLVEPTVRGAIALVTEPLDPEAVRNTDDILPQHMAAELLEALFKYTQKKIVFDPVLQQVSVLVQSPVPVERKGAFLMMGVLAEGATELAKQQLRPMIDASVNGIRDPEAIVRAAACFAMTQMADSLVPEILEFHKDVMPLLMSCMSANDMMVTRRAVTAIEAFCETLDDDILPYLEQLMANIFPLLTSEDFETVEVALMAVSSVVIAAKKSFIPYIASLTPILGRIISTENKDAMRCRAKATECVGTVALHVGKEVFAPLLPQFLPYVKQGFDTEIFELKEAGHNFFASLAQMLGADMAPLLAEVIPYQLATCGSDDGLTIDDKDGSFGKDFKFHGEDDDKDRPEEEPTSSDGEESCIDEDELLNRVSIKIRSGALDEKVAAISCLAAFAEHVGIAFMPYLEKVLPYLDELSEYPHASIRHFVVGAYDEFLMMMNRYFPSPPFQPGQIVPMHPKTKELADMLVPNLILRLSEEEVKTVAAAACDALVNCLDKFGLACLPPDKQGESQEDFVNELLVNFLQEKGECQRFAEGDEDDQEELDHDEVLIDSVTDLVAAMAKAKGPAFAPVFQHMFRPLMAFNSEKKPEPSRSMAIGCFAEVAQEIGAGATVYLEEIMPQLLAGMHSTNVGIRRNSAFGVGVMCQVTGAACNQYYPAILTALQPLCNLPAELKDEYHHLACRDNAISAIAKLVTAGVSMGNLPLGDIVPLFLSGLPLQVDIPEGKWTYPTLINLFQYAPAIMGPHMPKVISVFAECLGQEALDENVKRQMVAFCMSLMQQNPQNKAALEAVVGQLSEELRQSFVQGFEKFKA